MAFICTAAVINSSGPSWWKFKFKTTLGIGIPRRFHFGSKNINNEWRNDFWNDIFIRNISTYLWYTSSIYLKCIASHGGFSACERCTVKSMTINHRRVYPELDCPKRTKESFILKKDEKHHSVGLTTPLLELPKFDIIMLRRTQLTQ